MKISQLHNTLFVVYEITETSLIIRKPLRLFKGRKHEILFDDILIDDRYDLEFHDKSLLQYIFLFVFFFGVSIEHEFVRKLSDADPDWTIPIIFASIAFAFILRMMIKRTRLFIPTKKQGLIRLAINWPSKKVVDEFVYVLEGKVKLAAKKRPVKRDLSEFIRE